MAYFVRSRMVATGWPLCLLERCLFRGYCTAVWADPVGPSAADHNVTIGRHLGAAARAPAAAPVGPGDFAAVFQDVSAGSGPDEGLFLPVRHRRVRRNRATLLAADGRARRHQLRLYGVQFFCARGRAGEDGRRVAHGSRTTSRSTRKWSIDKDAGDLREDAGRGPRPLAEADQVRPAAAEGRQAPTRRWRRRTPSRGRRRSSG